MSATDLQYSAVPSRAVLDLPTIRTALAVFAIYAIYLFCTWSFIGIWWGDYALWMHEVDRVASGQVPYRDFSWEYPPLALYTYALAAQSFGSDVSVLLTLSAAICLGIFVTYVLLARVLVDGELLTIVVTGALLASIAYSSIASETLASGMYTPAAPLGGLLLLLSTLTYLRLRDRPRAALTIALGVLLALAVLTKPDFWLPSACILAFVVSGSPPALSQRDRAMVALAFAAILITGVALTGSQAGWQNFLAGLRGYSAAHEEAGRMFPSWERIVGQLVLLAGFVLGVVVCLRVAGIQPARTLTRSVLALSVAVTCLVAIYVAGTLAHVGPVVHAGAIVHDPTATFFAGAGDSWPSLIVRSLNLLIQRLRLNAWPIFLAPIALVWLLRNWRSHPDRRLRDLCLFLLCLSVTARARRLFEHVDWYHFLIDVPTALVFLKLAFPGQTKTVLAASRLLAILLLVAGAFSFFDWTLTPALGLPAFGRPSWGTPTRVDTAHGTVRIPRQDADAFRQIIRLLDQIDPSRRAPVFSTGNQGPWAYFTGRRNPTPLTYGFSWSNRDPESVVQTLLSAEPKPIVIDEGTYRTPRYIFPQPAFNIRQWELTYQESYHTRIDRPFYERILAHYELAGTADGRLRTWSVYRWKEKTSGQQLQQAGTRAGLN